jgi:hypothetical protein
VKINASQALSAVALVGAIVLFALGKSTEAEFIVAFMAGHLLPSPLPKRDLNPTPASEAAGIDDE